MFVFGRIGSLHKLTGSYSLSRLQRLSAFAASAAGLTTAMIAQCNQVKQEEEACLNAIHDAATFSKFFFSANLLGTGDYGFVFEVDDTRVVKVIDLLGSPLLSSEDIEANLISEVAMQEAASNIRSASGHACVPPVLSKIHRIRMRSDDPDRFLYFVMPKMQPLCVMSHTDVEHIVSSSHLLVTSGFLHNDMHAGNVMQWETKPILIDVGLMTQTDPVTTEPIRTLLQYAQCSALIDCCNRYNCNACTNALGPVRELRNRAADIFVEKGVTLWNREVESQERYIARVATQVVDEFYDSHVTIQLQLILAHLSLQFACEPNTRIAYQDDICDVGAPIGDAIYAIRNPGDFGYCSRQATLLQDLQNGRIDIPQECH